MKKIAVIAMIVIAVFGIVASVSSFVLPVIYHVTATSSASSEAEKTYLLKEYNGQIGVFTDDKETPDSVLDVMVNSLPEYDRQSLKNGIFVTGDTELNSLIEDLTS